MSINALRTVKVFVMSLTIGANASSIIADESADLEMSMEAIEFPEYLDQLRIASNSSRELPDINLNGYREARWGELSGTLEARSTVLIPSLGVEATRYLDVSSASERVSSIRWRVLSDTSSFDLTLQGLVEVYGEPSARNIDGSFAWFGAASNLELRPNATGAIITLSPAE